MRGSHGEKGSRKEEEERGRHALHLFVCATVDDTGDVIDGDGSLGDVGAEHDLGHACGGVVAAMVMVEVVAVLMMVVLVVLAMVVLVRLTLRWCLEHASLVRGGQGRVQRVQQELVGAPQVRVLLQRL